MKPVLPPRQLSDFRDDDDETQDVHPARPSPGSPVGTSTNRIDSDGGLTVMPALYQPALRSRISSRRKGDTSN